MEARQPDPRFRHPGCQPGHEAEGFEDDLRGCRLGTAFNGYRTLPFGVSDRRFSEMAGPADIPTQRSSFWR